jgi:hypothetical protein
LKPPVFEFRPLSGFFAGKFRRYSEGKWIEDDGEYDLAFIGDISYLNSDRGQGSYPGVLYFDHVRENILCSWTDDKNHWHYDAGGNRYGNAWHYALKEGKTDWGDIYDNWKHPNEEARRLGSDVICKERNGCSGKRIELHADDMHIAAGKVRWRDTKETLIWSKDLKCMYCGASPNGIINHTIQKVKDLMVEQVLVALDGK